MHRNISLTLPLLLFLILLQLPFPVPAAADWYVRLIVTAPDDAPPVRTDSNNVFGRLKDSFDGQDSHDLPEMPPPSGEMGDRYLSIVFPHSEWGGNYDGYAGDFRAPVADETQGGNWIFEMRTRTSGIRTVISWEEGAGNPFAVLPRSQIRDATTGAILVEDTGLTSSYTVENTKEVNRYIWEYLGDPCGNGRDLPADTWLMTAPSCVPVPTGIDDQYGTDLCGTYGTDWISFEWLPESQDYNTQAGTAALILGEGNWNYSTSAGTLSLSGTATPTEDCSAYGWSGQICHAIDLRPSSGTDIWQLVGHPFPYTVDWADVRIASSFDGSVWTLHTPSAADSANLTKKDLWRYSGSAYETYDDSTLGMIGILRPQESFWMRIAAGSSGLGTGNFKLLIPAR